jgi:hypothetical protein
MSERDRIDDLKEDARYRRERLELYKAKLYAGRARRLDRLRELQRSYDGAADRLRRAQDERRP